jgi:NAD(P)-dependent dehydrogenase (short-subunit alcohol dehydrogenase family)
MTSEPMNDRRRTALVTGGTGGIGRAIAVELARRGHRVIIVGRDAEAGQAVLATLRQGGHTFLRGDLSLLGDTARVAGEVAGRADRLDAVVLCAGVFATAAEWTDEDLERTFVLNYLSRYLMLRLLLPSLMRAPSGRVVLVANAGRYPDTLDFDDLQMRRGGRGLRVAGRTQFANDLLAIDLADELRDSRVEVTCVFPGMVATDVFRNARGVPGPLRAAAVALQQVIGVAPAEAAQTPVFLADDPAATRVGGSFFGPRRRRLRIPDRARRPDRRAALRIASEELVRPWLPAPACSGAPSTDLADTA